MTPGRESRSDAPSFARVATACRGLRGDRAGLRVDAALVASIAAAPVLLEAVAGYVRGGSDLGRLFQPMWAWWFERWRLLDGWNPWLFGGFASGSDPQLAALHPFTFLYALLPGPYGSAIEGTLAPALAGVGMLLYLTALGCGRAPRLLGALSFALGGYVTAHAPHPVIQRSAMLVPWGLLAIEVLDGRALAAALGLVVGLILLAGHPQVSVLAVGLLVAYAAWLGRPWREGRWPWLGGALALGAAIGAPLWLPGLELIGTTTRVLGGPIYPDPTFAASDLPSLLVPLFRGGGIGPLASPARSAFACGIIECTTYPGWLAWVAVLAGGAAAVRSTVGRFWLVVALLALVAASGALPLPTGVRGAARVLLWWNVAFAALAAIAADRALRATTASLIACGVLGVLTLAIAWRASAGALVAASVAVGLAVAALLAVRLGARAERWVTAALAADLLLFASTLSPAAIRPGELERLRVPIERLRAQLDTAACGAPRDARTLLLTDFSSLDWVQPVHLATVQGYNPLVPASSAALLGQTRLGLEAIGLVDDATLASAANRALDVLRIGVVVRDPTVRNVLGDAIAQAARSGDARWESRPACSADGLEVFFNRRALPVAWLVQDAEVVAPADAIAWVRGAGRPFDPVRRVLLSGADAAGDASGPQAPPAEESGTVAVAQHSDDTLALRLTAARAAYLVTSERAAPGWQAMLDGAAVPILLANGGFRAVRVPPGAHEVRFAYRPWRVRAGLLLGSIGVVAALVLAVGTRAGDPRPGPHGTPR